MALDAASHTICPQEIARINRQALHRLWWSDPEYQAIAAKRIEGETCHYCMQRLATLVHHDESWAYLTKEAYYDPENMTPICGSCHRMYRRGLVICPVCLKTLHSPFVGKVPVVPGDHAGQFKIGPRLPIAIYAKAPLPVSAETTDLPDALDLRPFVETRPGVRGFQREEKGGIINATMPGRTGKEVRRQDLP